VAAADCQQPVAEFPAVTRFAGQTGDVLAGVSGTRVRASAARGEVGAGNPEGGEVAEAIERAIAELPERQRMALVLFAIEGWPQRDVAEVLNCSLEAVKWNVFQARKVLRAKLAEYL
jgi:DNA-directed RNA polymerase specialized sigma24 family protein